MKEGWQEGVTRRIEDEGSGQRRAEVRGGRSGRPSGSGCDDVHTGESGQVPVIRDEHRPVLERQGGQVRIVDEVPLTSVMKTDRKRLRATLTG